MNELAHKKFGAVASAFGPSSGGNDELSSGIQGGFSVVSIRGKAWRIKYQGEERVLMRDDGDGPRSSMEVVLIKASNNIAKIYYENGYEEGSSSPPDCWSIDGQKPDAASPKKQCATCAGCSHNAFGSANNGKGKACQDSKRVAIVPAANVDNDVFGGPMLLRVPPASLKELRSYADKLNALGYDYWTVVTRLSLDVDTEYPRIIFNAVKPVDNDEDAQGIMKLRNDPRTQRILNDAAENVTHEPDAKPALEDVFEQPPVPQKAAAKPTPKPVEKPAPVVEEYDPETGEVIEDAEIVEEEKPAPKAQAKPAAKPAEPKPQPKQTKAETPVVEAEEGAAPGDFDDMLDELLG